MSSSLASNVHLAGNHLLICSSPYGGSHSMGTHPLSKFNPLSSQGSDSPYEPEYPCCFLHSLLVCLSYLLHPVGWCRLLLCCLLGSILPISSHSSALQKLCQSSLRPQFHTAHQIGRLQNLGSIQLYKAHSLVLLDSFLPQLGLY